MDLPDVPPCDLVPHQSRYCPALSIYVSTRLELMEKGGTVHSTIVSLALAQWWALSKPTVKQEERKEGKDGWRGVDPQHGDC